MKQLKVMEMIAKIEEKTDKKEDVEEGKEIKELRKRKSPAATLRNVTSTANKTDGNNLENKQKNDKDLIIVISKQDKFI